MTNDDMQFHMRRREYLMNQKQNQIAGQSKIQNLRDDPMAAAHSTRFQSYAYRLERYSDNMEYAQNHLRVTEGYVRQSVDMLQRVRELAVQGANGTYSQQDLMAMGKEVNELLEEFVQVANARDGEGSTLFSGTRSRTIPFRPVTGNVPGAGEAVITNVDYVGDIRTRSTEVADGAYVEISSPGNRTFWAENQQVYSTVDASTYQVQQDSTIYVDDYPVNLTVGDNVYAVINKINQSEAAVRARLDPIQSGIVLETTTPHQLWLRDGENSTVLQDLGLVVEGDEAPPGNLAPSADTFGGSMFDMIINLRDQLYAGNTLDIGGRALRGIDDAMNSLLSNVADIGARDARIQVAYRRNESEIPLIRDMNSNMVDPDIAESITELRILEYTHRAALGVAGRILQPTLMEFLR